MTTRRDTLRRHVETLAGEIGERHVHAPESLRAAASYIEQEWRGQGHEVVRQTYSAAGVSCSNLELTRHGTSRAGEIILVGAHYDTVPGSPGADDNGSGVAALLQIGRDLVDRDLDRTVRLVAFVNEEAPFFRSRQMGSQVYARAARERGDDIRVMISLEMLGCFSEAPGSQRYPPLFRFFYPDRGDFIALVSNLRSWRVVRRAAAALRMGTDVPVESAATPAWVPGVSWSDHLSFWREGYRALMVTDTAFYRYRYYHTQWDTPDKVDYATMSRLSAGLGHVVRTLASSKR